MILSTIIFSILIVVIIFFQIALAAGMPWGEYAMGGKFPGKLPPAMRAASLIQILILALLGIIVLSKAGLILNGWHSFSKNAIWVVAAFSFIASILNIITPSKKERKIWAPVSILLFITSLIVAVN